MYIQHYNIVTPLGFDLPTTARLLLRERSAIARYPMYGQLTDVCLSKIGDGAIENRFQQVVERNDFSRLEKLLLLAIAPIFINQNHPSNRSYPFLYQRQYFRACQWR